MVTSPEPNLTLLSAVQPLNAPVLPDEYPVPPIAVSESGSVSDSSAVQFANAP